MKTSQYLRNLTFGAAFAVCVAGPAMAAGAHVAPMTDFAKKTVAEWVKDPSVVEAINSQNSKHANLSESEIVDLDKKWRAETKASSKPLIDALLANAVSAQLKSFKDGQAGRVTEIFVMDNKGLNVGQSDVTSDYWQGDEAKWQKTYNAGPDAIFVDDVEMDESTQTLQSQVSMSVKDPATGKVIGAITVGVNVDSL